MALTGNLQTSDGVEHNTTYAKIIEANLNFQDWYGRIVVGLWHSQEAYAAGRQMISQVAIDLSPGGTQPEPERPNGPKRPPVQPMPPAEELLAPLKQTFGAELYEFIKSRLDVGGIDFTQWGDA